jgi:hypothetical protein
MNGRHVRRFRRRAIQNPAYRPADTPNGGSAAKPPGPRQFLRRHHSPSRNSSSCSVSAACNLQPAWIRPILCARNHHIFTFIYYHFCQFRNLSAAPNTATRESRALGALKRGRPKPALCSFGDIIVVVRRRIDGSEAVRRQRSGLASNRRPLSQFSDHNLENASSPRSGSGFIVGRPRPASPRHPSSASSALASRRSGRSKPSVKVA